MSGLLDQADGDELDELCDVIHHEPCDDEPAAVDLPADGIPLVDLGDALSIVYRAPDGVEYEHTFDPPLALWAWKGGIIVNAPVDETGIRNPE